MNPQLLDSLFRFETIAKIGLVLAASPLWWPILKVFWREIDDSLSPDGGFFGMRKPGPIPRRPVGLDPWRNVPHPSRRSAGGGAAASPVQRGSGARHAR